MGLNIKLLGSMIAKGSFFIVSSLYSIVWLRFKGWLCRVETNWYCDVLCCIVFRSVGLVVRRSSSSVLGSKCVSSVGLDFVVTRMMVSILFVVVLFMMSFSFGRSKMGSSFLGTVLVRGR